MEANDGRKFEYEKNQLVEVICQLRFPAILSIDSDTPAAFQEKVRARYPRYALHLEKKDGAPDLRNHAFISENAKYKISLTREFIAFSTMGYTDWTDFAGWMDEPLGHFISIYRPAFFERIGLRYVNGFSRMKRGLGACPWRELIDPKYLGVRSGEGVEEKNVPKCSTDVEMLLDGGCALRLHAGPGHIQRSVRTGDKVQQIQEPEPRFILDIDVSCGGSIPVREAAERLDVLHTHADNVFSGAVTDRLHDAMSPVYTA